PRACSSSAALPAPQMRAATTIGARGRRAPTVPTGGPASYPSTGRRRRAPIGGDGSRRNACDPPLVVWDLTLLVRLTNNLGPCPFSSSSTQATPPAYRR